VRITISSLRKRLGDPWLIHTVAGVGYRLDAPDAGPRGAGADTGAGADAAPPAGPSA
jgi:two-component system response regulator VanR